MMHVIMPFTISKRMMPMSDTPLFLGKTIEKLLNMCSDSSLVRFKFEVGLKVGSIFMAIAGILE